MKRKKAKPAKPPVFITDDFEKFQKTLHLQSLKARTAQRLMEKHRVLFECISRLTEGSKLFVLHSWNGLLVVVGCKVIDMKQIQPVLELLEKHLKISFDHTVDEGQLGWRSFTSKQLPWFRVDAEVADNSEKCKRVLVGYEQTPKYELHCEETAEESSL